MTHSEVALPLRPRLLAGLPVLRRGDDEIQLGLDPRHAIVIEGLSPAVAESIETLDGARKLDQLLARISVPDRPVLVELLHDLAAKRMIEDAVSKVPGRLSADTTTWMLRTGIPRDVLAAGRKSCAVLVHGCGRLAVGVAMLLVAAGVGAVDVDADGVVCPEDTGGGYRDSDIGQPRRDAARLALLRNDPSSRITRVLATEADLVVLTDAAVPAPEFVRPLLADCIPHLAVKVREGIGVVGPFVLPGRSSCLGCADLCRTELDPLWPSIAAQLAGRAQPADLAGAHATAALAAEQALRALDWLACGGRLPPTWQNTIEFDAFRGSVEHRAWLPHPDCPCAAY